VSAANDDRPAHPRGIVRIHIESHQLYAVSFLRLVRSHDLTMALPFSAIVLFRLRRSSEGTIVQDIENAQQNHRHRLQWRTGGLKEDLACGGVGLRLTGRAGGV
jgi:hypothetical protein